MRVKPVRLQRKRIKGFHLESPNGLPVVYVGRPSKWGNPFTYDYDDGYIYFNGQRFKLLDPCYSESQSAVAAGLVAAYESRLESPSGPGWVSAGSVIKREAREELRGKNLLCWCPLSQPCHADILLRIANKEREP